MGISIATKGMLWPKHNALIIREQYTSITATITDPVEITMEMEEIASVTSEVEISPELTVTVTVEDTITDEIVAETDVSGNLEDC